MKNKLILAVLPVLLIATACQARPQNREVSNIFLEDTLAHDEIFENDNSLTRGLKPLRVGDDPVEHPDNDPAIGIQYAIDNKGTAEENDDTISFRFVAAVTFTNENIGPTVAKWTRTVSKPNGDPYTAAFDTKQVDCERAYKRISNGGGAYTIDQFNAAQDPDTTYTHFVVYCLRNIPLDGTYDDYYISAYLSLTSGASQTTKAVAINVKRTESYSYNPSDGAFMLDGVIDGTQQIVQASSIRQDGNKAAFENVDLDAGDSFVIKEFYNTKLEIHGSSTFKGEVCGFNLNDDDGKIGINYSGRYTFYLKYVESKNELWAKALKVVRPMYVKTQYVEGEWFSAAPKIRLWCVKNDIGSWVDLKTVTSQKLYVTNGNFDPTAYDYLIVARTDASNINNWWNQTINVGDINSRLDSDSNGGAKVLNCIAVWTTKQGNNYEYGWEKATGNPID